MSKLLYIQASPRGQRSHSTQIAEEFIKSYKQTHAGDHIETLNVFKANLIPFDGLAVQAKYTILHGQKPSADEAQAWKAVEKLIANFKAPDKYILAVPMWNFGIPYRLKQYIDILVQPGYTFSYSPEQGYKGLVTGKRIFVAYARGGAYSDPAYAALDHQKSYLETILGFMGMTDVRSVIAEPTLMGGPEVAKQVTAQVVEQAKALARDF